MTTRPVTECEKCQDDGLLACTCLFYANWITVPPCPAPQRIRTGGYSTGYRDGWKQGYARGVRDARRQQEDKVA